MPSSISNSDERLPRRTWRPVLLGAILIALCSIAAMEGYLASQGYRTTLPDSAHAWGQARARASQLGRRALILVGNSRMQLDVDLGVLRRETGLQPVQLALDGSPSFMPVLEALANDPTIQGTLLISYLDSGLLNARIWDRTAKFEAEYEWSRAQRIPSFRDVEPALDDVFRSSLRSYADGTRPIDALLMRIFHQGRMPQFVTTLSDRSQFADFTRVPMQDFYYGRAQRELGRILPMPNNATYADLDVALRQEIAAIKPVDNAPFLEELRHLESLVATVRAHGGRVVFVYMPSSGLVRDIERNRYPRTLYWDKFVASTTAQTLHFEDDAALSQFVCPDGSHLDVRQRAGFTEVLVHALGLAPAESGKAVVRSR